MTVMATLTADRRQHGRHNQILALNLRSDVRRIERAVHPRARAILRLRDFIDHQFAQIVGYISVVQTGSAPSHNDTLDLISWGIEACFNRIRAAVDPEGLADAIPVLNGAAMESLQRVKLRLREVEEMVEIYRRYAATYDRQAMSANADTLAATLRGAEAAAMELRQYLLDIESEYRAAHIALAGNH
jgi:hypothetical protein